MPSPKKLSKDEIIENLCEQVVNDLKELRESKKITTAQLGEMTGLQQPNITRLETGGTGEKPQRPNLKTVIAYAYALGAKIKVVIEK